MRSRRRRVWRAVLSALAGGGLTAAALGGPLTSAALAAASDEPSDPRPSPRRPSSRAPPLRKRSRASRRDHPDQTRDQALAQTVTFYFNFTLRDDRYQHRQPAVQRSPPSGVPEHPPSRSNTNGKPPRAEGRPARRHQHGAQGRAGGDGCHRRDRCAGRQAPRVPTTSPSRRSSHRRAAGALAAELASSAASAQALSFYRIPLFLLPIYKAAAVQYGVPWQILAAINEIETNYGTDQSVSTAGAVGWMQFMPTTWTAVRRRRAERGLRRPLQPGRRDLRRRPLPARGRRLHQPPHARSSPTTTPRNTSARCSCAPN